MHREAADLKQFMSVIICVQLETAPTPRHCDVCRQSTVKAIRELYEIVLLCEIGRAA